MQNAASFVPLDWFKIFRKQLLKYINAFMILLQDFLIKQIAFGFLHQTVGNSPLCCCAGMLYIHVENANIIEYSFGVLWMDLGILPLIFDGFFLCRSLSIKKRVDVSDNLTLEGIRNSLIRQEDSIIFSLLERAQYCYNADTYNPNAFSMDGFHGSLVEYMVKETEKLHAQVC